MEKHMLNVHLIGLLKEGLESFFLDWSFLFIFLKVVLKTNYTILNKEY